MTAFPTHCMTLSFEERVSQRLADLSLTMPELARLADMPEAELGTLCQLGDPRLSEVQQLAKALHVTPAYFLSGSFNQAGIGNTQKIKIGKAAAHELAAQLGVCRHALDMANRLVAAKEEIITLLRASYNRPN